MPSILSLCTSLYGAETGAHVAKNIRALCDAWQQKITPLAHFAPTANDACLITYAASIQDDERVPLQALAHFLHDYIGPTLSTVHILPFYPSTSDEGFAVSDYRQVDPAYGTWDDITAIAQNYRLGCDAVFNHVSSHHPWFTAFLQGDSTYKDWFVALPPDTDLSSVTRARSHPLLTPFNTDDRGTVHVWTTFSDDQIDLNPRTPAVLCELIDTLFFYIANGATLIRLDAIAFLWKEPGTCSIHLPQTHDIIRLFRLCVEDVAPHVALLVEANVPHQENISYFGTQSDEAHMVYQFPLPPLVAHAILRQNAAYLQSWIAALEPPPPGNTFLNFLASHDGIGLRPTTGILDDDERAFLCDTVLARGGRISYKTNSDGSSAPYEMNINYLSLLHDGNEDMAIRRFLLAHALLCAMPGIPAIYIHSLLGSLNDQDAVKESGQNRAINRARISRAEIDDSLEEPSSRRARVFYALTHMLRVRKSCDAFNPHTPYTVHTSDPQILLLERVTPEISLLAIHNFSEEACVVSIDENVWGDQRTDILTGKVYTGSTIELAPYHVIWAQATR